MKTTLDELIILLKSIKKKNAKNGLLEVVIDGNEDGFYSLESVYPWEDEDGNEYINLKSSNEL